MSRQATHGSGRSCLKEAFITQGLGRAAFVDSSSPSLHAVRRSCRRKGHRIVAPSLMSPRREHWTPSVPRTGRNSFWYGCTVTIADAGRKASTCIQSNKGCTLPSSSHSIDLNRRLPCYQVLEPSPKHLGRLAVHWCNTPTLRSKPTCTGPSGIIAH